MSFIKMVAMTASALVLQGCVTGNVSNVSLTGPSEFEWKGSQSVAMNVMRAGDMTKKLKDVEVDRDVLESLSKRGELRKFNSSVAVAMSSSAQWMPGIGSLSNGAALGMGLLAFLAENDGPAGKPHWVVFTPITDVQKSDKDLIRETGIEVQRIVGQANADYVNNHEKHYAHKAMVTEEEGYFGPFWRYSHTNKKTGRVKSWNFTSEATAYASADQLTGILAEAHGQYLVHRVSFDGNAIIANGMEAYLPDNVFFYDPHGSNLEKGTYKAPRVYISGAPYFFVVPNG